MRKWAAKRDSDGHIVIVQTNSNPQSFLDMMAEAEGETYTLMNEQVDMSGLNNRYRECWEDDGNGDLQVNMTKARAEKMTEIRAKRDEMLKKSDEIYIEELSKGQDTTDVQADKDALRDLPANVQADLDAESDVDALEAYDAFAGLTLNKTYE